MSATDNGKAARAAFLQGLADLEADNAAAAREEAEKKLPPVRCMGMEGTNHVLYSTRNKRLHKRTAEKIGIPALMELASLDRWAAFLFPEAVSAGEDVHPRKILYAAQEWIFNQSGRKTFNPEQVRGRGVWPTSGGWVYNAGSSCWHIPAAGGKPEQVDNAQESFIYEQSAPLPEPKGEPLSDDEGKAILDLLEYRPWQTPGAGELSTGWAVASMLPAVLPLSPHLWINAPSKTGKSTFRDDMRLIFGTFQESPTGGATTGSGIRQVLNGHAIPVVIDEAEGGDDPKAQKNIRQWIELMRLASYGGVVTHGSADGTPRKYLIKASFALFSVANSIEREADSSRFLVLEMRPWGADKMERWKSQEAGRELVQSPDFHGRLISRLLRGLPVLMKNIAALTKYLRSLDGVDSRRGELFAVLMACRYALTSSGPLTPEQMQHAAAILRAYGEQEEEESDSVRCLAHLLGHQLDVFGVGKMTVSEACRRMSALIDGEKREAFKAALDVAGLRWRDDLNALQVDPRPGRMKRIFCNSQWSNGKIAAVLAEGADRAEGKAGANSAGIWYHNVKLGGSNSIRCVMIPSALILSEN